MNHEVKKRVSGGRHRVIYHAHCTNLIALTFVLPLDDKVFTRELWEMATECPVVFPDGVGVVPWMVPGGRDIAVATSRLMETYDVAIWAHHGAFASGETFDLTFGLYTPWKNPPRFCVRSYPWAGTNAKPYNPMNFGPWPAISACSCPNAFCMKNDASSCPCRDKTGRAIM